MQVEYDVHMDMTENEERLRINFKVVNPEELDIEKIGVDIERMRKCFFTYFVEEEKD